MKERHTPASRIALAGVLAGMAVAVMALGGFIPIATFVCPMLAMAFALTVKLSCGARVAWAWYGAVAILSAILSPDREAAGVFLFLGYYPLVKQWLDGRRLKLLWKGIYFNLSIGVLYFLLLKVLGLEELNREFQDTGAALLVLTLVMGNVTFFLMDVFLTRLERILKNRGRTS